MTVVAFDDSEPAERFERWRETISSNFVPLVATPKAVQTFSGELLSDEVGTVQISEVRGGAVEVSRTKGTIKQSDPGLLKVGMQLEGYCVINQDGREAALVPGDFAIYDTSRPYTLQFEKDFAMLVVMFPRERLHVPPRNLQYITARRISGRQGLGALISPFLMSMGQQLRADELSKNPGLADSVIDLLSATFAEQLDCPEVLSEETRQNALTMRIRAYIEKQLSNPELSASTVAGAHHISPRYLQRLFAEEETTVTEWIRARRLENCRRDLEDSAFADTPTGAIAARWGMIDPSYFSRLFRSAYGISPSDVRPSRRALEA